MNIEYVVNSVMGDIKQKLNEFCQNHHSDELSIDLVNNFTSSIKDVLADSGKVMFKEFITSFECHEDIITRNNETYRFKKVSSKKFLSAFGELELSRRIFQKDKGGKCIIPLDEAWGMQKQYAVNEVKESILYSSALMTPEESSSLFKKCSLFQPSSTAIKNIIKQTGKFITENFETINEEIRNKESVPENSETVVLSMDGANVMLNEAGTRKGRPTEQPKDNGLDSGKTTFRNAMVGCVSHYTKDEENKPIRIKSTYLSRMPEERFPTFKNDFENEVKGLLEDKGNKLNKILLMDGGTGLWGYVNNNRLYDDCRRLIDFFHVTEHLSRAIEIIFGKSNEFGKRLYLKQRAKLKEEIDGADSIYRSLKYHCKKIPQAKRKSLEVEITFFKRNKKYMTYAEFREEGLPIGSGPMEAACKSIVKTRLCRSGMRWSRKGGQNILYLRTFLKSNRWGAFWNSYTKLKNVA